MIRQSWLVIRLLPACLRRGGAQRRGGGRNSGLRTEHSAFGNPGGAMKKALRSAVGAGLAAALLVAAPHGAAQSRAAYPTKPVRLIVSSGAGGGLDFVARQIATPLSETLGQTVVVDNRAGASGSIAAELASQATPDGYTLMFLSASLVVYGIVNRTRYDLYRDFA